MMIHEKYSEHRMKHKKNLNKMFMMFKLKTRLSRWAKSKGPNLEIRTQRRIRTVCCVVANSVQDWSILKAKQLLTDFLRKQN